MTTKIKIKYCVPCGYLAKAEEFKKALEEKGGEVELVEGDRGVFDVWVNDKLVFSKHEQGRYPEIEEITSKLP
ncbi:MAG: hypothetical protein G01um10145_535 [Microgenomates group bacterium Gr01-1014_5]|nr:MAG: hypothetical protein G01um10145_535 [Microgenomates group bacterium Gr01-1014_5]